MSTELIALLAVGVLHWLLAQVAAVGKISRAGVAWGMGNRETEPEMPAWVTRTEKAHRNLGESLPLFICLVVAILLSHSSNRWTTLAAGAFLVCRLAHAGFFMAGITYWRTVAYQISLVALGVMLLQLL